MLFAFVINAVAAQTGAVLYPSAGTTINGNPSQSSAAALAGDRIQTAAAPAQLASDGTAVQLEGNTALTFGKMMELGCGSMVVTTSKQAAVHVGDLRLTPAAAENTRYQILHADGTIQVAVQAGSLVVTEGQQKTTLLAGQSLAHSSSLACSAPASATPSAAGKTALSARNIAIAGGVAGGAAAAAVLATRDNGKVAAVSPSRP